jgi:hypothetical protein
MSYGCRIWNAAGDLIMDVDTRIARILGVGNTGGAAGSISPAGMDTGEPFVFPLLGLSTFTVAGVSLSYMTFSVTATTISWNYGGAGATGPAIDFLYGVR